MTGRLALVVLTVCALLGVCTTAATAAPAPSLCSADPARGSVPATFAIDACVSGQSITVRNTLSVPITLLAQGDIAAPTRTSPDQSLAASVTRRIRSDPDILMPGDVFTYPVGRGRASLSLKDTSAGGVYIEATTLTAFMPFGAGASAWDAMAGLIVDVDNADHDYAACIQGTNFLQRAGCAVLRTGAVDAALVKAAALGLAKGAAALLFNTALWMKTVKEQVPAISAIVHGERTITLPALPPPPQVTAAQLLSAPVPAECQHPAGHLVNGELPVLTEHDGFESISVAPSAGGGAGSMVSLPFSDPNARDAAVLMSCSAGGVGWPAIVLLYAPGPELLGAIDLGEVARQEHADVTSMTAAGNAVQLAFRTYDGAGYDVQSWTGRIVWNGHAPVLTGVTRTG